MLSLRSQSSAKGGRPGQIYQNIVVPSALRSSLKTGKRPEKDWTRTGLLKTAVLVFPEFEIKDCKRPFYMDRLRPVKTGLLYPSIIPSN